jgi:hypothetical protein
MQQRASVFFVTLGHQESGCEKHTLCIRKWCTLYSQDELCLVVSYYKLLLSSSSLPTLLSPLTFPFGFFVSEQKRQQVQIVDWVPSAVALLSPP